MDEEVLALVAIVLLGTGGLVGMAFSPIGRALADRIRGRRPGADPASGQRDLLEDTVDDLKRDVEELTRQLHFMERLLAGRRAAGRLGPGDVAR